MEHSGDTAGALLICRCTRHLSVLAPCKLNAQQQVAHVLQVVYSFCMLFAKSAILLEWCRIFSPHRLRNTFFWVAYAIGLLNILLYVATILALNIACRPLEKLGHPWVDGTCSNRRAVDLCTSSFNLVIDLFILVLPQQAIWSLHMSRSRKFGISLIFSLAIM